MALVAACLLPASAQVYPSYTLPAQTLQTSAGSYASRTNLVSGTYTFTFATPYNSTPVCLVSGEGSLVNVLQVTPSTNSCIITSSSVVDTQMVDIIVIGNPN